jgi:isopenicillin N synthase-like dioxygenase
MMTMLIDHGPDFENIPVFDMQEFIHQDKKQRAKFITKLRDVCHHIGFFYIKNHGIDVAKMERILHLTEEFFNLPQAEKDAISIAYSPHYRGYGKLSAEMTEGIPDFKETYDLGLEDVAREMPLSQAYKILQGPNQWPTADALNPFYWQETVLEYIAAMQKIGEQLMMAMSLTLNLPEDFFANQFRADAEDSYVILRMLHYPPGKIAGENEEPLLGVGPHIDAGCLVMLLQDKVGGLQVQNCSGQWIDAPPIEGTLVVNIGTMLQIWSNNYFLATPHRVINRSKNIRHSVPFFYEPNLSTVVTPLDISTELLETMQRPRANSDTRMVYGEHILHIYERSFKK